MNYVVQAARKYKKNCGVAQLIFLLPLQQIRPKLFSKVGHPKEETDRNTDCYEKTIAFPLIPAFLFESKLAAKEGLFMMPFLFSFVVRWHVYNVIFFFIRNQLN